MTLEATEAECAANAVAPRVSLDSMKAKVKQEYSFNAFAALSSYCKPEEETKLLSIVILLMENGFMVVGKSAPASAANFNAELGYKLAYEDAIRQLWPLEGYALRDRLKADKEFGQPNHGH